MNKAILIALLVPAVALAAPRKKGKTAKKAAADAAAAEKAKADAAAASTPTPDPAAAPGGQQSGTTPTGTGLGSGSGSTTPTVPTVPPTGTPPTGGTTPAGTGPNGAGAAATESADAPSKDADVDSLRQEYLSLRDELFKSRARANAVASQLYSTRVTIKLTWGSARYYGVSKASIRLDGATVFEDATGAIATDDGVRFDGYVAPGRHLVTFRVEATGKDDDSFTSATESQIVVKAVAGKDLVVAAKGKDDGDIAYAWKKGEKGSYGLGIDVAVKAVASGTATKGKK